MIRAIHFRRIVLIAGVLFNTNHTLIGQPCSATISASSSKICEGSQAVLTSSPGVSYLWNTGATTQSINVNVSGSYYVTVTDASACIATSTATIVTVTPLPVASITPDGATTFCQGGSITLTSSPGSSYLWSTGETAQSIAINSSGSYTVSVTDANGCSATSSATTVTVNPLPVATITPGGAITFCQGGSVNLASSPGSSYLWSTGETAQSIVVNTAGSYTVSVTDANGCSAFSAATTIVVNPLPVATIAAGGATTFCQGGSVTLSSSPGSSYLWSTGETTQSIVVNSSGSYTVSVTDANGCSATSSVTTVTVNPLPAAAITADGATTFCQGGSVTLSSSPGSTYLWSTGETSQSIVVNASGSYIVTVTDANGCSAISSATTIVVNPLPVATIAEGGGTTFCQGGSVTLSSSPGSSYLWSTGETTQFIVVSSSGSYTVSVTDANGCSAISAAVLVTVNPLPIVYSITGGGAYCNGETGLSIGLSNSEPGVNYQLYRDLIITGPILNGTGTALSFGNQTIAGTYTVVATNTATSCVQNMTGNAIITINPLPAVYNVTGGGTYCSGGSSLPVGLSNSEVGVNYQLYMDGTVAGGSIAGNGSTISFGNQSSEGTYTVVGTNSATSCTQNMSGDATITINPLPISFNVTGGGSYCTGGTGVAVGLDGSQTGVNYQLRIGASNSGSPLSGTGADISFGLRTTVGTYTVVATDATTSCVQNMPGSATIIINALPTVFNLTGGGTYCDGGSGLTLGLTGSQSGVNYQLRIGGINTGNIVPGTGSSISFGSQTGAGSYSAIAIDATTSCTQNMSGNATITINPLPTAFNVTGGGSYCSGGTGVAIGLSGSQNGVTYQLRIGAVNSGASVNGTGAAINFGLRTTAGIYTVVATNGTTSCTQNMSGSATISVNPLPTIFNVTGGGSYCSGGAGMAIGLSGSQSDINYQLRIGGVSTGNVVPGNGSPISFGNQTLAGTYSVIAIDATTSCTQNMSGNAAITINPLPTAYNITGGGSFCSGGAGVSIGLSDSRVGINYQLYQGATSVGPPVSGTNSAISFGNQTTAGTYTVLATNPTTSCTQNMSGSATISINPLPTAFNVTGGGTFCSGGTGVSIGLSGSQTGVNYQLRIGASNSGSPVSGTGAAISFGLRTTAGTYTVVATNTTTSCTQNMSGSVTITINPLPTAFNVTGGGSYCSGGTGLAIGLGGSQSGVNYQLRLGGLNTGSIIPGTGSSISFGNQTAAGTYTVIAIDAITSCTQNMSGNATITVNPLPTIYNVTGGGGYCSGGTGVAIGLSGSQNGVTYQLRFGVVNSGASVNGTGASISFGLRTTTGTYTVIATNSTTSCTQNMTGNAAVTINPLPAVFNVTGGGSYCSGGAGMAIGLSGSESGINYQLRIGGVNTGSTVPGTGSSISFGNQTAAGTYTVIAFDATTSCTQNMSSSAMIIVNPLPTVASISGPASVCTGSTIPLTNTTTGGTWSSSNTAIASISNTGTVTGISEGTVTIYYSVTNANGCTRTVNRTVTVNSTTITIAAAGPITFCRGTSVSLTASGASNYTWSPVTGLSISTGSTVIATPEVTTTYVVTGTGATGCTGTAQVTVTVNQIPEGIMSSDPAVCSGSNSGTVDLTITDGSSVIGWESSTNGGTSWSPYTPTISQYSTAYLNLTQTTVYRALLQLNGCPAYSSIGIIPVNNVLRPTVTASATVSCLNTAVALHASGYGQPPFPVEDFQNANPAGWSGDNAGGNNEDSDGNWSLTNSGKIFNGRTFNSQAPPTNSKFFIVTGITDEADHNATLTAPPFSLVGTINPVLSFYTALNFSAGTTGIVQISTDGGNTYTNLITYTGPAIVGNSNNGWVNVTYSLVPYINQPDVRIRFNYTGTSGSNWGIDNVGIISTFQPIIYQWLPLDHLTPPAGNTPDVTILPDVGLHQYCVSSTTAAGCESDTVCITINVLPLPVCNIEGTDAPVCPSSVNSFTAPAGMSSYLWSITGNGSITAGANIQNVTVTAGIGCNVPFTITLTITDIHGCISTCSKTVMVQDIIPPVIICPSISAQYRMNVGVNYYSAVGTEFDATATDNCTISSITHNLAYSSSTTLAGYHFPVGSTTVTWTAVDACGLSSSCQIIITVIDDQPPTITCPPPITVQCAGDVPAPYINYAAFTAAGGIATDNNQIDPALFGVYGADVISNQTCENRYTISRTYQISDLSGNIARCTQTIIVNDEIAPVITSCPANQIFCETQTNSFTIPVLAATDNCAGAVNITFVITGATERAGSGNDASGHFNTGTSTISWTVTDVCGNVSTCRTGVLINPLPVTSPIYHQ